MAEVRHSLKTDPEPFEALWSGSKRCELRFDDRGFRAGDFVEIRETKHSGEEMRAGAPLVYTGRWLESKIAHVQRGYGLLPGWVCLSINW